MTVDPICWSWPVLGRGDRDEWAWLAEWQALRCGICAYKDPRIVMDHDHRTGLIRGWLCRSCNLTEGHAHLDEDSVYTRWRSRSAATMLGIRRRYENPIFGTDYGEQNVRHDLRRSPAYFLPFGDSDEKYDPLATKDSMFDDDPGITMPVFWDYADERWNVGVIEGRYLTEVPTASDDHGQLYRAGDLRELLRLGWRPS